MKFHTKEYGTARRLEESCYDYYDFYNTEKIWRLALSYAFASHFNVFQIPSSYNDEKKTVYHESKNKNERNFHFLKLSIKKIKNLNVLKNEKLDIESFYEWRFIKGFGEQ